jgi:hypothetical protein
MINKKHNIITIDPDTVESAYTIVTIENEKIKDITVGVYDSWNKNFWVDLIKNAYLDDTIPMVVLENQFINIKKGNHKDIIKLLKATHKLEFYCTDLLNIPVHSIYPSTWQSFILKEYGFSLRTYKKNKVDKNKIFKNTAYTFYTEHKKENNLEQLFFKNNLDDIISSLCISYYITKQNYIEFN